MSGLWHAVPEAVKCKQSKVTTQSGNSECLVLPCSVNFCATEASNFFRLRVVLLALWSWQSRKSFQKGEYHTAVAALWCKT